MARRQENNVETSVVSEYVFIQVAGKSNGRLFHVLSGYNRFEQMSDHLLLNSQMETVEARLAMHLSMSRTILILYIYPKVTR